MRGPAVIALVLLAGCADEPDFDQRYSRAEEDIRLKAQQIDGELREEIPNSGRQAGDAGALSNNARQQPGSATDEAGEQER